MNILFICTGNTCRSPMAAGLMNKIVQDNDLDIHCESAGMFAELGSPASAEAIAAANRMGVDISTHRAQNVTAELIKKSDLILTMTESHKMMLALSTDDAIVYTLGEYAGSGADVSDPYGGDSGEYIDCCDEIYELLLDATERIYDEHFKDTEEDR